MASADILRAARARIADPKNWTQSEYARNSRGFSVPPDAPDACKFCALGAIMAVGGNPDFGADGDHLRKAANQKYGFGVTHTNDALGHAAVLSIFDAAIAAAEAEAGR